MHVTGASLTAGRGVILFGKRKRMDPKERLGLPLKTDRRADEVSESGRKREERSL